MRLWLGRRNPDVDRLAQLERKLGYRFRDRQLLKRALSHRSSLKETGLDSNERLEFLGDAVLGLIVSEFLYRQDEKYSEGDLTRMKASLVNETVLSHVAVSFGLGEYLYLSAEEEKAGGRFRSSITADALEAMVGAVYLDGGYRAAMKVVAKLILKNYRELLESEQLHNYKGELLEFLQARGKGMPQYRVSDQIGPDHEKTFIVAVYANGEKIGEGEGRSKKEAEQKAARQALARLKNDVYA